MIFVKKLGITIFSFELSLLLVGNYDIITKECRRCKMAASYKKLWKLLIDKDLKKKDLISIAEISNYTLNKLTKGENVTTDILGRICKALDCNVEDIMEFVENDNK